MTNISYENYSKILVLLVEIKKSFYVILVSCLTISITFYGIMYLSFYLRCIIGILLHLSYIDTNFVHGMIKR